MSYLRQVLDGLARQLAELQGATQHRGLSAIAEAEVYAALLGERTGREQGFDSLRSLNQRQIAPSTPVPPVEPTQPVETPPHPSWWSSRSDEGATCRDPHHDLGTRLASSALGLLTAQLRHGLFITGDNVMSPPDTAFTANSLVRLVTVLQRHPGTFSQVHDAALELLSQIADALVTGGIHTPNHRWEIASALTGCARLLDRADCQVRAEQWLAEGVDLQPDGFYSERSPNYAVHVSGPSLSGLAEDLQRPDLFDAVHTNVHVHAATTDPSGRVETMQSRRQDQFGLYPVSQFVPLFLLCATRFDCSECAGWWATARRLGEWNHILAAHDLLLARSRPVDVAPLPFTLPSAVYEESGLAVISDGDARLIAHRLVDQELDLPIGSGVNANPVVLRWVTPDGGVRAIRLARRFFNLGPLRPTAWHVGDRSVELSVRKVARYYHPLQPEDIAPDGAYPMEHEGRFSAAMAFSHRSHVEVMLETTIKATLEDGACRLEISSEGPAIGMALELLIEEGGPDESLVLTESGQVGGVHIEVLRNGYGRFPVEQMAAYEPGDPYDFLRGTDRLTGQRVIIPLSSEEPAVIRLCLADVTR